LPAAVDRIRTRMVEGEPFSERGVLSPEESATLEQSAALPQLVYSISEAEVSRAKIVHEAHVDELMKMDGVQGVGITSSVDSPGGCRSHPHTHGRRRTFFRARRFVARGKRHPRAIRGAPAACLFHLGGRGFARQDRA